MQVLASERDGTRLRLLERAVLVPAFVLACYVSDWRWLRSLLASALIAVSSLVDLPMTRLGGDLIAVGGRPVRLAIGCTLIDAFFGAIPLLWRASESWRSNAIWLAAIAAGLFAANIARLEIGFAAWNAGMPWWLAHECVAGLVYFLFLRFIVGYGAWRGRPGCGNAQKGREPSRRQVAFGGR